MKSKWTSLGLPVFAAIAALVVFARAQPAKDADSPAQSGSAASSGGLSTIVILHDNDIHFDFNHPEAFKKVVDHFRHAYTNVFLLSAGDIFTRNEKYWTENSLDWYAGRCRFMLETMNAVDYDAMTLGNNELDYKETATRDALRLARFPVLGANVIVKSDVFDKPKPYTIFKTPGGLTVAVLGVSVGNDKPDVYASSPIQAVQSNRNLRENNVWILLTHTRSKYDQLLAEQFPEVDAIIGGHSAGSVTPAETINGVLYTRLEGHSPGVNTNCLMRLGIIRFYLEDGKVCGKAGEELTVNPDGTYTRALKTPVIADLEFPKPGAATVSVRNPLALNTLSLKVALQVEGSEKNSPPPAQALLKPGERRTCDFPLPADIKEGAEVLVQVDVQHPADLPEWERSLDFQPVRSRAPYKLKAEKKD